MEETVLAVITAATFCHEFDDELLRIDVVSLSGGTTFSLKVEPALELLKHFNCKDVSDLKQRTLVVESNGAQGTSHQHKYIRPFI